MSELIQLFSYGVALFIFTYLWYIACCKVVGYYKEQHKNPPWYAKLFVYAFILLADVPCNLLVFTFIGMEVPRVYKNEWTVTARMKRWKTLSGWKLKVSLFMEPLLDYYDPTGDHY